MRILVVQESDWLEKGPHQSHHLMERLSKRGHEIRVIDYEILWRQHAKNGIVSKREAFENVHKSIDDGRITVIRPAIVKLPILDYISLVLSHRREIKRQIREFRPDVIIGFGILNASIGIDQAEKNDLPFIYYIIDELHRLLPQRILRYPAKLIEMRNMRQSRLAISINEGLRDYTIRMGAMPGKTLVIRAGIDLIRFDFAIDGMAVRDRYGIAQDEISLFFMGWLYEFSGLKEIAEEMIINQERMKRIKLMVIGKGDLWNYLSSIKDKMGDRLILLDWQPYEHLPELIASSNICILPSRKVSLMMNIVPIKMYEYMAMKKPVIATNLPGIRKEFGESNGVIYVEHPPEALEKALELDLKREIGKEGERAFEFVKGNDWDTVTDLFERTLMGVL